ncbi:MAG: factor-independent urate hydroxylase [Phycisphaerales bacterium]
MAKRRAGAARAVLGQNNYGKSRVRMVKVSRAGKRHTVREISVDIALEGDFDAIHTEGDNRLCLPTDTMKNTVYALGKDHPIETIESFGLHLAEHFVRRNQQVRAAAVRVSQTPWERVAVRGREHPHTFVKGSEERQECEVRCERAGRGVMCSIVGRIDGLVILKSTDSAFSGYPRDEFTTLPETRDRIFCTSVTAEWNFESKSPAKLDFGGSRESIRQAMINTFAAHKSESVQQTLYAMGEAALRVCRAIRSIRLSLPNKHCLLVNLAPFGMANKNEIFAPTDEPHGLIEATIGRK